MIRQVILCPSCGLDADVTSIRPDGASAHRPSLLARFYCRHCGNCGTVKAAVVHPKSIGAVDMGDGTWRLADAVGEGE